MHRHLLAISSALALATLLGCASSSKPPDDPSANTDPISTSDTPPEGDSPGSRDTPPDPEPASPKPGEVKKGAENGPGSIPDDYMITNGDCVMLGRALAGVTRADQVAQLSPKLNEKQRAQAEESINAGSDKTGDKFAEGCQKSSAGNTGDPKSLKCALNAKTAKEFEGCLNAPVPPK
jgi:hypothetical protein